MTHKQIISNLQTAAAQLTELATAAQSDFAAAQAAKLDSAVISLLDPGPLQVAAGGITDAIAKIGNHESNLVTLAQQTLAKIAPAEASEIKPAAAS
jgi:hypothetical protein